MVILTSEQMRRIDERTETKFGIPSEFLMDAAGREVASALLRRHPDLEYRRVLILCGKGNNGGDGMTAARHLRARGVVTRVALLSRGSDLQGAAAWAWEKARADGIAIEEIPGDAEWRALRRTLPENDVLVDALLGTGTRGAATGRVLEAIEAINAAGSTVVSVDIPSGLSGSTAEVPGPCVEADVTIALAALKVALVFPPACKLAGVVEVADIGIPAAAFEAEKADLFWLDAAAAAAHLPERKPIAHKGDFGHALIVAGSRGKSGAAILMARACLRSGAGLVTVACPASVQHIIATAVPEAMTEPLPETADGAIARGAVPKILALLKDRDVLATGPGIGTEPETREVVLGIARGAQKPMVLDADALNILSSAGLADISGQAVITPHPGEAGRLLRRGTKEIQADRLAAARELAAASGCVSVLKGYRSLVAEPGGRVHVNESGNPGMATGGSGDVLTGIVVAWLAQGLTPANAALLSVFAHGRAGDISAGELGEISLMAGDIINGLPAAYRELTALRWKK